MHWEGVSSCRGAVLPLLRWDSVGALLEFELWVLLLEGYQVGLWDMQRMERGLQWGNA